MKAMCGDAPTKVRLDGREGEAFGVRVRRGSVLGPLLFIIVLEALSGEFGEGLPVELLCADGLVLIAEAGELLLERVGSWRGDGKEGSESEYWRDRGHVVWADQGSG